MAILELQNITKTFVKHTALDDVSIKIPEHSVYGLIGHNGAGKTTLIRIMTQIIAQDSGNIYFNGSLLRPQDVLKFGYLPEERGLYKKMKVGEQALYLAQLKGLSKQDALKRLKYWFEKFEIEAWWHKKVEELSKGMQQKVQFIATIIHQPQFIIFDEPFSGFDPLNATLLKDEIIDLNKQGATIIFSTHNMTSVEEMCTHIALLNHAKKVLDGRVFDIKQNYKQHLFELSLQSDEKIFDMPYSWNLSQQIFNEDGSQTLTLKLPDEVLPNEFLSFFMTKGIILNFKEILPTMNDIFIHQVKQNL